MIRNHVIMVAKMATCGQSMKLTDRATSTGASARTMFAMVAIVDQPGFQPARLYIAEWREHFGLTQEQVAERLDTSKGQISRLENGKRTPNNDWLTAYANALGIRPEQFYFPPKEPSLDAIVASLNPDLRRQIHAVVDTMIKNAI